MTVGFVDYFAQLDLRSSTTQPWQWIHRVQVRARSRRKMTCDLRFLHVWKIVRVTLTFWSSVTSVKRKPCQAKSITTTTAASFASLAGHSLGVPIRYQFHQHFTSSFFIRKSFKQLFCTYGLGLYFFGKRKLVQMLLVKSWWNWLQVSISQTFYSHF